MIDISSHIRIALGIEQGSVFNFFIDFNDNRRQSKNRYFVVLNRRPKTDTVLLLVTSTTQIAARLDFVRSAHISESTIVTVTTDEYPPFTKPSAFNCNDVFEVPIVDLVRKIEDGGSMNYPKMPPSVLQRIIDAVKISPRIPPSIKALL